MTRLQSGLVSTGEASDSPQAYFPPPGPSNEHSHHGSKLLSPTSFPLLPVCLGFVP